MIKTSNKRSADSVVPVSRIEKHVAGCSLLCSTCTSRRVPAVISSYVGLKKKIFSHINMSNYDENLLCRFELQVTRNYLALYCILN